MCVEMKINMHLCRLHATHSTFSWVYCTVHSRFTQLSIQSTYSGWSEMINWSTKRQKRGVEDQRCRHSKSYRTHSRVAAIFSNLSCWDISTVSIYASIGLIYTRIYATKLLLLSRVSCSCVSTYSTMICVHCILPQHKPNTKK